ncbi:MAG TPA: threonine synthase [Nitrososphaerales archaeon]|nr:threonine synthase [Nitrososphaerales archaeon]
MRSSVASTKCISCGAAAKSELPDSLCAKCGSLLEIRYSLTRMSKKQLFGGRGPGIWRFKAALPFSTSIEPVSLNEGNTPLVLAENLRAAGSVGRLYFKNDGQNPTGSFKDRGMSVAMTRAKTLGARALVCASTGNTAASLAAYAAKARLPAVVVVPQGKIATGKLGQAFAYGARVFGVAGNFDAALNLVFELVKTHRDFYLVNSVNPFRIEGQKVAAFEIYEQLGEVPDYVVLPVGNAGNISALWKGFKELRLSGISRNLPRMIGVQAEGAAPIAEAVAKGGDVKPWPEPNTVASAIRIGSPVSWRKALAAIKESGGTALTVSDEEILQAREELATKEGLLVEAASAAPAAALKKLKLPARAKVVCIATGNGLKDLVDHGRQKEPEPVTTAEDVAKSMRF